jgi:hypothetical protein
MIVHKENFHILLTIGPNPLITKIDISLPSNAFSGGRISFMSSWRPSGYSFFHEKALRKVLIALS